MQFSKRTALAVAGVAAIAFAVPALADPHSPQGGQGTGVACGDGTLTWDPTNIWPPNHKYVPIHISYSENDSTSDMSNTAITVTGVTEADGSNPPQDASLPSVNGSGDPHVGDAQADTDPANAPTMGSDTTPATYTEDIRAERSGRDGHGSGRVYTLTVQCTDSGPEMSTDSAPITVSVPHDQGVVKP